MRNVMKSHINKTVALMSVFAGVLSWFGCHYIYTTYSDKLSESVMIGSLCAVLFAAVFLTVLLGSMITGSFNKESELFVDFGHMAAYFICSLIGIFVLVMGLEFIYECNPNIKSIEPTSYIFVIDESGSMSGNDPGGLRYEAIPEIMKATEKGFLYMVYTFSDDTQIIRDMAPLDAEYEPIPVNSDGGTAICGTIIRILQDYKNGVWDGGSNPKVVFLTDGSATDLSNGFLWFRGNMPEFNAAIEEYYDLDINISTVGLGSVDREIMTKMAETTGGVFVNIQNASDLASAMKNAASFYSDRNLLSIRYMKRWDTLYGFLRILFLTIIGTVIGSLMLLAYMEDSSIPIIIVSSIICSLIGSVLFEIGLKIGVYQSLLWIVLWALFSLTPGHIYPKVKRAIENQFVACIDMCRIGR
ncbi:VWA domain-containing protein [Fusicatenibacter saccharivorans]|uniref:VWA domain-containing protein n=1 Tax=Fusicatenibacter saccharivorans TaxID=1150298 RepID=UPI0015710B0C|nr:VWA domain-containing protein [Fusicatenibacter saccharivorans]NSE26227.1 VWA domain-containing protein [Fusicatenibacter saccharivorans]